MANKKITDLSALTPADGDLLHTVDISDTTDDTEGTSKKFTLSGLASWLATLTQTLTNKTLTAPVITNKSSTGTDSGVEILTNKNLSSATNTLPTSVVDLTTAQTLATKTFTTPVLASFYQDAGKTKLMTTPNTASDTLAGLAATQTFTNKRITKRSGTVASAAAPTINTDNYDFFSITAQTEAITNMSTNLSGTPTEGQTLWIAITGTAARAITWGDSFEASAAVALPTTTVTTARLDVGFVWNTSKWRCVASA